MATMNIVILIHLGDKGSGTSSARAATRRWMSPASIRQTAWLSAAAAARSRVVGSAGRPTDAADAAGPVLLGGVGTVCVRHDLCVQTKGEAQRSVNVTGAQHLRRPIVCSGVL